ncbi:redox-sensitive transcriptional activator SoxR [Agromyces aerolatus]|uniref:redox-sensitive transcriptional activator SoxR n=1 Tax=Agromyces sp. LY-1074 TaxID=3074080 RepID=UPI002865DCDD|nr:MULTISPECIES: redox-sensitive transcriptional activator SoxR [unclassified Agromyces]MDR5701837.1 redox-sensitive transcriptional activator SoxR [Agromyces sp. LY-1074]MDR5708090.1 redox-sensitive transcriptional activator SoxR [Agromyces sp. LY-1358]
MADDGLEASAALERALAPDELLSIGEMSRRTGVAASALRFYEELGLIAAVRTGGNQRRYPRHMLRRVSLVTVAKRLGIPLGDVQEAFAHVPLDRTPSHEDWQRASRQWKRRLEDRRRGLEKLERELTGCIGCGCLSMKACALLNPGDALGDAGSGPRRLEPAEG